MPMAGQVLAGLEQIHDLGYLHRDISPKRELCGELQSAPANWGITYEARTDIGTRKVNQDNLMVDGLFYYEGTDFRRNGTIDCRSDEIHMAAVCDGVGGSNHGELASRAVIQALRHFLEHYGTSEALPERLIEGLLDQVNAICFGRAGSPASAHPIRRHR